MVFIRSAMIVAAIVLFWRDGFADCYGYVTGGGGHVYVGHLDKLPKDVIKAGRYTSCDDQVVSRGRLNREIVLSIKPDLSASTLDIIDNWLQAGVWQGRIDVEVITNEDIETMKKGFEQMGITDKALDERSKGNERR